MQKRVHKLSNNDQTINQRMDEKSIRKQIRKRWFSNVQQISAHAPKTLQFQRK